MATFACDEGVSGTLYFRPAGWALHVYMRAGHYGVYWGYDDFPELNTVVGIDIPFACDDGVDNDGDGVTDAADIYCTQLSTDSELNPADASANSAIIVRQETAPDDPQDFNFTASGGGLSTSFVLDDDGDMNNTRSSARGFEVAPGSGFSISQTLPAGWYLGSATCDDGSPRNNISVSAGEVVICTFINSRNYPRPGGGTPLRVPLVPEFQQCTSPDSQHVAPLSESSCSSPQLVSSELTTGSAGQGGGSARLDVQPGNPATPADEADLEIVAQATDVRNKSDGSDYTGRVILSPGLRVTDRANSPGDVAAATASDLNFSFGAQCNATPGAAGATCTVSTTADTIVPGTVLEGKRAVISAFSLVLKDLGPNGSGAAPGCEPNCGDGDESVFLRQGVFAP